MRIENTWMLLPDRTVRRGTVETEGAFISRIEFLPDGGPEPTTVTMPGLVNAHGHTAMTLLRGLGSGLALDRWLHEAIFPVEARLTREDVYAGNLWGVVEMLASGTTSVVDMYDFPEEMEKVLAETGFGGHTCRVGLSFAPNRLAECIAFTRAHENAFVSVHSEYLTDEAFCRALAAANNGELKRPLHFHVSETQKEHEECLARHGLTPIAYLARTGLLDQGGYAAHGVFCTDDDFRTMAEKGVVLVHNPTSNLKLGSGVAPVCRARACGVKVALGTDGCASNDNLNLFEEMHLAYLLPKGLAHDPTALGAWDVLDMATCGNALAVGARADLCVADVTAPHLLPVRDLPNRIVASMQASDVIETVVGGQVLYDHGAFPTLDVDRARTLFLSAVRRLGL